MTKIDPKSEFLKNLIKGLHFSDEKDRKYFKDLEFLEELIVDGVFGPGSARAYQTFKIQYPNEMREIIFELKPDRLFAFLEEQADREISHEKLLKELAEEERLERKYWLDLGGQG